MFDQQHVYLSDPDPDWLAGWLADRCLWDLIWSKLMPLDQLIPNATPLLIGDWGDSVRSVEHPSIASLVIAAHVWCGVVVTL